MQINRNLIAALTLFFLLPYFSFSQVNAVQYGKNRVQFKKNNWKFYQSPNFNTYVSQGGVELGKFVAQIAEEELPGLEKFIEYSLQRRANIVVYNSYDDYKQTNIGLGTDWEITSGGLTKLVNNKIVLFFDGNHDHLKLQIREGIAKVLANTMLFGDNVGDFASNQALLDLPQWLTDGYIEYAAQNWSTEYDNDLRNALMGGDYNNFYAFAFKKPQLAGHAFWYYISKKYKKENVTYFLYLARLYKSVNRASQKITNKKFKELLSDFMQEEQDLYYKDIRGRRNAPKGRLSVSEDISKNEYYRFQANPNQRNNSYAVVEFSNGVYKVKYVDNNWDVHILINKGVRTNLGDMNPNYPILAWDEKGTRLLVIYWEAGKTKMFVYDAVAGYKRSQQVIEGFDQILDASYMQDANTLVFSAVKNGHSDIYTYKIQEQKAEQITNDVYDDLNPTFVSFPNRSGIIFSSNRPSPDAPDADTVLPSKNRFNIYLVDVLNKNKVKQLTKLTNVKYGNAMYPMQYNNNHFTFVSDENGVGNRWAGFFSTQRNGVDTLYYISDEVLHNPSVKELDSTLNVWKQSEPDSVAYFQVYKDSTYTFPITNYQSSLLETRIAGNNGQVSETRQEGDYKFLYKLRVDENALDRRNISAKPTEYMKGIMNDEKIAEGKPINYGGKKVNKTDTVSTNKNNFFQNEFSNEKPDTASITRRLIQEKVNEISSAKKTKTILSESKLFNYRLKFATDYLQNNLSNSLLVNRYQPYAGGSGPVVLDNGSNPSIGGAVNNLFSYTVGVSDLMEDIKFVGGYRFGNTMSDKDVFFSFNNYRRRLDWGLTYYRSVDGSSWGDGLGYPLKLTTNLYQANISYPFDETRRVSITAGYRSDDFSYQSLDSFSLTAPDSIAKSLVARLEYVYDNTLHPTQNIYNGTRWKVYLDVNAPIKNSKDATYNVGFDYRHYHKIYRNFIWAARLAGDFSFGNRKIIYYLGGVDGWINPKFNNNLQPDANENYAFQSLAINMRGYKQNAANGSNAFVFNSEFRLPVFTTFLNTPVNNAFLRNFQLVQFIDIGSAWDKKMVRPTSYYYNNNNNLTVKVDGGGIGPLAAGYGFGARSTLLGSFIKVDCGWPMLGLFRGKPVWYFALGFDF